MKILIHDLEKSDFRKIFPIDPPDCRLIGPSMRIYPCIFCGDCWYKTPGQCPIDDDLSRFLSELSTTEEILVISRCEYGSVSLFVKNVLDRMRGILSPVLELRDGDTQFRLRENGRFVMRFRFYGEIPVSEQNAAEEYAARLCRLFNLIRVETAFCPSLDDVASSL